MAENSKIQWTDHTFNPWIGCTKVSPGCTHCYAEKSYPTEMLGVPWGKGQPRHRTANSTWKKPQTWNRKAAKTGDRPKVFCASLCDIFDSEVSQEWREDLWALINHCRYLDWQLLTKRLNVLSVDELLAMVPPDWRSGFPDHVWFGHSITTQAEHDRIVPMMKDVPAKIRYASMEPMLEPISFSSDSKCLSWVIIGGESGPRARPFDPDWTRSLISQCRDAGVAVFMKQVGSCPQGLVGRTTGKGGDPSEWPKWMRVREMPSIRPIVASQVQ